MKISHRARLLFSISRRRRRRRLYFHIVEWAAISDHRLAQVVQAVKFHCEKLSISRQTSHLGSTFPESSRRPLSRLKRASILISWHIRLLFLLLNFLFFFQKSHFNVMDNVASEETNRRQRPNIMTSMGLKSEERWANFVAINSVYIKPASERAWLRTSRQHFFNIHHSTASTTGALWIEARGRKGYYVMVNFARVRVNGVECSRFSRNTHQVVAGRPTTNRYTFFTCSSSFKVS